MAITLGRRLAMLELIFKIPPRALTHQKIADCLNELEDPNLHVLNPQVISRIFTGAAPDRFEDSAHHHLIITTVVRLLDNEATRKSDQFWALHGTDADRLITALGATTPDFLNYLATVAKSAELPMEGRGPSSAPSDRRLPILPTIEKIPREHAELLDAALGGYCFFYRLGTRPRTRTKSAGVDYIPVLRRIPVRIRDIGENYLEYKDNYTLYGEEVDEDWADGYAFYTKQHFTIVAADFDTRGISELFLIQLKEKPIARVAGNIHEGLIVMNGDLGVPTACKVLFRRAPEQFQDMLWEEFVQATELSLELSLAPDETFKVKDKKHVEETDGIPFSFYTNKLQIKKVLIDLQI